MMTFWESFVQLCKEKGESPTSVCLTLGMSNAAASGWKNGKLPRADVIGKLADYFGVSADEVLGRDVLPHDFMTKPRSESDIVAILNLLDTNDLKKVRDFALFLLSRKNIPSE